MIRYIEWMRDGLLKPGKTQRGLATALGVDPAAVNRMLKGDRRLKVDEIGIISAYLEEAPPNHTGSITPHAIANKSVANQNKFPLTFSIGENNQARPRDVPILGHAKAGELGLFIDNGSVRGLAMRPDSLEGVAEGYAVYVQDESMVPAFKHGKLVYVNPIRPVQPGDDVVIQLHDGQAFIKTLVRRTEKAVIFKQYNPAKEIKYAPADIKHVHFIATADR